MKGLNELLFCRLWTSVFHDVGIFCSNAEHDGLPRHELSDVSPVELDIPETIGL